MHRPKMIDGEHMIMTTRGDRGERCTKRKRLQRTINEMSDIRRWIHAPQITCSRHPEDQFLGTVLHQLQLSSDGKALSGQQDLRYATIHDVQQLVRR